MAKRRQTLRKPPTTRKRVTARKRSDTAIDHKKENVNLRREPFEVTEFRAILPRGVAERRQ